MSVSNFEDKNYTEQQGTIQLSTLGTFANGINYGAGYVEFAVSQNGDSGDYLRLTSASNPNANGAVSITGSVVYLGNGTSKIQIGTVDAVNNGQDGHALRINFDNVSIPGTSPVVNGDFSRTNGNSSNIPGWTAVTQHIDLGVTKIAGWATPEAPLIGYPSNTPGGNDNDLLSGFDAPEVKVTADGRLLLQETGLTSTPFGVVHGPAAYSDVFAASAGMVLKFDWTANNVSDDYHVVGYLLNADTGAISIALQGWGTTGAGIGSVGVPATGNYRFVFVSGSYDKTGGQALGASMYIDNIRVESGAITDAVVQTLARQVVYENTSDNPAATKTVTVSAKNINGTVSTDALNISVTQVNDAPVKTSTVALANGTEDVVYTVSKASLLAGFSDPDGDVLNVTGLSASQGTVTANADGSFSVSQAANFNGNVTLQYTVSDGHGGSLAASKTFLVAPVNDAPVAAPDSGMATVGGAMVSIDVLANDTDVDAGDTKTLLSVNTSGTKGSVSIVDGKVSYDPAAAFQSLGAGATATDTFTYTMKDSAGATSTATVTMTVTGVNDAPVAVADKASVTEDGAVVVDVLANDTDVDAGDTRTLVSVNTSGATGSVSIIDGKVSYDPGAHFQSLGAGAAATDTFSYTMKDSAGVESTATVTVTINGVNDGPVAVADSGAASEDGGAVVIDVLANDTDIDAGDTRTLLSVSTSGTVGSVSIASGKISYDPGAHFQSLGAGATATDTFSYTMKDSAGVTSTATVTMTINGVNDGPVAVADSGAASEDGKAVVIDVLANDTDVDAGDTKTLVSVNTAGTVGSVSIVDGKVSYDPGAHFQSLGAGATVTDTFSYTMKDSAGVESTATVTMTINGVNDGPVAVADSSAATEDGGAVVIDVLANDTDVDAGDTRTLVSVNTAGTVGSVSIVDGKVSYDPGAHFQSLGAGATATDTFTYTMKDSAGATSTATVTMTINGVNDGPVAVADSGTASEDGKAVVIDVLANDTDVDAGDTKTLVSVNTAGTVGSVSIVDGKVSYDPGAHFQSLGAGATATDTFSYTMKDSAGATSTATVTMTINGVNDGPAAVADSGAATEDGAAVVIDVLANDTDVDAGDSKTLVSVSAASTTGSVSIVEGKVKYDPGTNFQSLGAGATATDTVTYTMKDSAGATSTATVTMTVTGVNDAPVAVADSATVQEKQTVTINVLANDTDIDAGDAKLIASADSVSKLGGTVSIVNGALQYSASADTFDLLGLGQSVTDSFSYTMKDAKGALSSTTVTVKVMGAADGANIVGTVKDDAGTTALVGTALDEHIHGDNGSDELFGNGGSDHLFGENGEDTLDGGNGIDFLDGGNGKDVLIGGRGSDVMTGGEGNDLFVFNKDSLGTDVDVITDFKVGNDMLRLLDNLAIASTAKVDYNHDGVMDTELVLSNGTHIELLGVSNLANTGLLLS